MHHIRPQNEKEIQFFAKVRLWDAGKLVLAVPTHKSLRKSWHVLRAAILSLVWSCLYKRVYSILFSLHQWLKEFQWLKYDSTEKQMKCKNCLDAYGCKPKSSPNFVHGANNWGGAVIDQHPVQDGDKVVPLSYKYRYYLRPDMPLCSNADLLNLPPNKINWLIITYLQWSNGMGSLNPRWGLASSEKADQIKDAHSGSHGNWHEASEGLESRRYKARSVSRACFLHCLSSGRLVDFFCAFYSYNICFQDSAPFDTIVLMNLLDVDSWSK